MKQNVWKILAIVFFAISLIEFIWGYAHINDKELKIKELEMKLNGQNTEEIDWEQYRPKQGGKLN